MVADYAKNAAKTYWEENKDTLKNEFVGGVKKIWDENKDKLLDSAKGLADKALIAAKEYTDSKITAKREETLKKLYAAGHKKADIDSDQDGEVSDDELAAYLKSNPTALLAVGGSGLAFLLMWYARQAMRKEDDPEVVAESAL